MPALAPVDRPPLDAAVDDAELEGEVFEVESADVEVIVPVLLVSWAEVMVVLTDDGAESPCQVLISSPCVFKNCHTMVLPYEDGMKYMWQYIRSEEFDW